MRLGEYRQAVACSLAYFCSVPWSEVADTFSVSEPPEVFGICQSMDTLRVSFDTAPNRPAPGVSDGCGSVGKVCVIEFETVPVRVSLYENLQPNPAHKVRTVQQVRIVVSPCV